MPRVGARESDRLTARKSGGFTPARVALRLHIDGPACPERRRRTFTLYGSQGAT
jgi:hypothetical protein